MPQVIAKLKMKLNSHIITIAPLQTKHSVMACILRLRCIQT